VGQEDKLRKTDLLFFLVLLVFFFRLSPVFPTGLQKADIKQEGIKISRVLLDKLNSRTTDQIMVVLEPQLEMDLEELKKEIGYEDYRSGLNTNEFFLHLGPSCKKNPGPGERFEAYYGNYIVYKVPFFSFSAGYIKPLSGVIGKGSAPHAALVEMVKQLVERGIIDPVWLLGRLK
jgi:hypothetical protein